MKTDTDHLELVDRALAEDVGTGDVTTEAIVEPSLQATATIRQKADGVIFGLDLVEGTFHRLDPQMRVERLVPEGIWHSSGTEVVRAWGSAAALLTGERTALNFLGHLSGIASYTARLVKVVREVNQNVAILDTRKTTPGLRYLEKAAVLAGGGVNHRVGLFDAILIKENHIAIAGSVGEAIRRARIASPELPLAVEVRNPAEIKEALSAGAPRLLLDNMSPTEVRDAVSLTAGRAQLEVSGGITLDTVSDYAEVEGVDFLSLGALTHSAKSLDLSMIMKLLPN